MKTSEPDERSAIEDMAACDAAPTIKKKGAQMKLFTEDDKQKLLANGRESLKNSAFDPWPVVKLSTPDANCTWLVTEIDPEEQNRLWVLADLGFGCCEYGTVGLPELLELRGRLGLPVERDLGWKAQGPISAYIRASNGERLIDRLPKADVSCDLSGEALAEPEALAKRDVSCEASAKREGGAQ